MKIVTDILFYTNSLTYFDINSAGPTLLKHLSGINLLDIKDKNERNVKYGKAIRNTNMSRYIPYILYSFSKIVCYELDGILYTQDSVVTNRDISKSIIAKNSIFTFKKSWISKFLVISKDKKSYFAITDENKVIVKNDILSPNMLLKLYLFYENTKNWIFYFKKWFMEETEISYFITNKNSIYLSDGTIVSDIVDPAYVKGFENRINKEFYWFKLLKYFQSIYLF